MSIRKLAKQLGLAPSTVSQALRGDREISESTRARVEEAARAAGYVLNPVVQAAMQSARAGRTSTRRISVAYLHDLSLQPNMRAGTSFPYTAKVAEEMGKNLGFDVSQIDYAECGGNSDRVNEILRARGIRFCIFANAPSGESTIQLDDTIGVVAIGPTYGFPAHRVFNDTNKSVMDGFEEADRLGARRIGLVIRSPKSHSFFRIYAAPFLGEMIARAAGLEDSILSVESLDEPSYSNWIERFQPDFVITSTNLVFHWEALKPTVRGVHWLNGIVGNCATSDRFTVSTLEPEYVIAQCFRILSDMIYRNETGAPAHPIHHSVAGQLLRL